MSTLSKRQPLLWALGAALIVVLVVARAPAFSGIALGAFILSYVCAPAVDLLARRLRRSAAVGIIMAGGGIIILGFFLLLVPLLITQYHAVSTRVPQILDATERVIPRIEASLGIDLPDTRSDIVAQLRQRLTGSSAQIAATTGGIVQRTFGGAAGIFGGLISFGVLVPMVGFYLLLNWHGLWPPLLGFVPPRHVERATTIKNEIDAVLSGFVRGQLTVASIVGATLAIGFTIVGIDGAVVIGLLGGFLNMIPIAGAVIGHSLAILMAILKFDGWTPILGVIGVIVVSGLLEQMVITPRIVGDRVGLPPLAVLLAVIGAGEMFGFVGMLLAVPAAAVIKVLLVHARRSYRASEGYTASAPVMLAAEPAQPAPIADPLPGKDQSPP